MNGGDGRGLIAARAWALLPVSGWARTRGGYAALPFDNGERPLVRYPQKRALIGLTTRPPQLETPLALFDGPITPNDAEDERDAWDEYRAELADARRDYAKEMREKGYRSGQEIGRAHV